MLMIVLLSAILTPHPPPVGATRGAYTRIFAPCGAGPRITCVVDGDTFWLDATKIRIADINTPEVSRPNCAAEKVLGDKATRRMIQLLNRGPFELLTAGQDEDHHGRKLRIVIQDGQSLGDQLIREGLAEKWTGRRRNWCRLWSKPISPLAQN